MFEGKRIAVLGAGKLGEALITGMIDANVVSRKQFIATAAPKERLEQLRTKLELETTLSNSEAVRKSHLVLLCVKPQSVEEVLRQVSDDLTPNHIVISVAASVTTRFMETIIDKPVPVIRTMPNTPCFIKKGMTAIAAGKHATADHVMQARKIFDAIGRTLILDEKHTRRDIDCSLSLSVSLQRYANSPGAISIPQNMPSINASTTSSAGAESGKRETARSILSRVMMCGQPANS